MLQVSDSFPSHLEDFELANPDDGHVLKVAMAFCQPSRELASVVAGIDAPLLSH